MDRDQKNSEAIRKLTKWCDQTRRKLADAKDELEALKATDKFHRPDKGFSGTESSGPASRDGPVQFEKQQMPETDLFGLDKMLSDAKGGGSSGGSGSGSGGGSGGSRKRSSGDDSDRGKRARY